MIAILSRLFRRRAPRPDPQPQPAAAMPGFDAAFYLDRNPDVRASAADPLGHYLQHGWREGREPSQGFQGQLYLELNPDVQAADVNPLTHFLEHGLAEGRHWRRPPTVSRPDPEPPGDDRVAADPGRGDRAQARLV